MKILNPILLLKFSLEGGKGSPKFLLSHKRMNFTFGIVTAGDMEDRIRAIVDSIIAQQIPTYEILIVGDCKATDLGDKVTILPFDETVKRGWLTRKKNLICQRAAYETVVLLHDYIRLEPGWYEGFLRFGDNFQICVTPVLTHTAGRFRDFTLYPWGLEAPFQERCLIPYTANIPDHSRKLLYISGAYYIIKRNTSLQEPLDERLVHCAGDDVEFTQRLARRGVLIQCNPYSQVKFLKWKEQCNWEHEIRPEDLATLCNLSEERANRLFESQCSHLKGWIASNFGVSI